MQPESSHKGERESALLIELQNSFDNAIRRGESFSQVKKIYIEIRDLKRYLTGMTIE